MSLSTLFYAYLLGGVTFIPLLLVAVVLPAWLALPRIQDEGQNGKTAKEPVDESAAVKAAETAQDDKFSPEGAASASFAVLRSYNFPSAVAALNAKNAAAAGSGSEGAVDGAGQESVSVYQSMYRSVFDRSKTALHRNTGAEPEDDAVGTGTRARTGAPGKNLFYVVLRHGHLMLYDSPAQVEVRHVISLAHHSVWLSDGDGADEDITDADLFVKRTAILLEPNLSTANGIPIPSQPKPFYLFSSTCSEKEDFYHALLAAQNEPPVPQPLDPACAIKLQSTLHSTSLTPETRALNALISRIFLALHRTPYAEHFVRSKIERKISRVQKPAFIASLAVQSIDLGDAAPILSNPRLKDLHISGDMVLAMDCKYTGGIKMVISAVAKLDLGPRFKVRTVDLVLAGILQRLQGRLLVRIKPPPSNRIWFCFDGMPDMDLKIEPVVSSRQITYTFILRAIENRIREVVAETLVKPNWDDLPFFNTVGQTFRGGVWQREPEVREAEAGTERSAAESPRPMSVKDMLGAKNEKTMSLPILPNTADDHEHHAATSGSQVPGFADASVAGSASDHNLKRRSVRSVMSLPPQTAQMAADRAAAAPRAVRSPSFATPAPSAPSVAVDGANVDAVRGDDPPRVNNRWMGRTTLPVGKRDAADVVREVRDRATPKDASGAPSSPDMKAAAGVAEGGSENDPAFVSVEPEELETERKGSDASSERSRNASMTTLPFSDATSPTTPSRTSTNKTDATTSFSSGDHRQRGKNFLAATAAATSAARQWTWNAVAARKEAAAAAHADGNPSVQEPMGRGQPLPPPGTPLPGPQTQRSTLWGGSGFGSVKRKPVLPVRRPDSAPKAQVLQNSSSESVHKSAEDLTQEAAGDGYGPCRENHGKAGETETELGLLSAGQVSSSERRPSPRDETDASPSSGNAPPPLPPRRKRVPSSPSTSSPNTTPSENEKPAPEGEGHNTGRRRSSLASSPTQTKIKPKLPARPTHRSSISARSNRLSSQASFSLMDDGDVLAIPAPVDPDTEERGELELDEADGKHLIEVEERRHEGPLHEESLPVREGSEVRPAEGTGLQAAGNQMQASEILAGRSSGNG